MNVTVSMDSVLNFINSMSLSASNKEWLGRKLIEEAKAEACDKQDESSAVLYKEYPLSPRLQQLRGCAHISQEEIDSDERLAYILSK